MARGPKNQLSQSAAWLLAVFGTLFVAAAVYLIFKLLDENRIKELEARDAEMRKTFTSLKQRRFDRIEKEKIDDEERKKSEEQIGIQGQPKADTYWSYEGSKGPFEWANLSSDYVICEHGKRQSPIDLVDPKPTPSLRSIKFNYKKQELYMENNGNTLLIKVEDPENFIKHGKDKYILKEITFHTPSEHYIDGAPYDMEIQFHHQNKKFEFLNVSVFVDAIGGTHKLISNLWKDLPFNRDKMGASLRFNPRDLLPIKRRYFLYEGSMTVPPCTENTTWIVMREPIRISIRQLDQFRGIIKQNARPIQKRNGITLKQSKSY